LNCVASPSLHWTVYRIRPFPTRRTLGNLWDLPVLAIEVSTHARVLRFPTRIRFIPMLSRVPMFYCVLNAAVPWATTIGVNRSPDDSILSPPCDPEAENESDFTINPKSKSPDPFDFSPVIRRCVGLDKSRWNSIGGKLLEKNLNGVPYRNFGLHGPELLSGRPSY